MMRTHGVLLIFVFCSCQLIFFEQTSVATTPTPSINNTVDSLSPTENTTGSPEKTKDDKTSDLSNYCPSTFNLTGSNGTFTSPMYPSPYPLSHVCRWEITVAPGKIVQLTFTVLDVEAGKGFCYDSVEVYGGTLQQGYLIGTYCGSAVLQPITTTTNVMTVIFNSDSVVAQSGFQASFVSKEKQKSNCGAGYFRCNDDVTCVDSWRRCDGRKDCFDNSDESGCECQSLPLEYLFCKGLGYNRITLPNPYMHRNASEAINSRQARTMVRLETAADPVCHPDFNLFACAMIMPKCSSKSPRQLLPCRTLCEEVTASCRPQAVLHTNGSWPFPDCSRFPYPSNNTSCFNAPMPEDGNCYYGNGVNYRGRVARSNDGQACAKWSDDASDFYQSQFPWANLQENYCRNPDEDTRPWCLSSTGVQVSCELPRCGEKTCFDPGPPRFGTRSPRKATYLSGDKLTFSCGPGYILADGSLRSTCQSDGTWTNEPPICDVDHENNLLTDLFERNQYKVETKPTVDITVSTFQGRINNIVDTNEKDERVMVAISLNAEWVDHRLTWIEQEYGNIRSLFLPDTRVWKPTLQLRKNADTNYKSLPASKVLVTSDGHVNWTVEALTTTTCTLDPYLFPVDTMNCPICFESSISAGERLKCPSAERPGYNGCKTRTQIISGQWKVVAYLQTEAGKGCMILDFTRDPIYHIATTISPCIILAVLMCITFATPIEKSDRIGFGITILLAMVVSLVVITDFLPVKDKMPFIAVVIIVCMGLIGLFMLFTCVIINLSSKKGDMPPWAQRFFLRYLATFLLFGDLSAKNPPPEHKENGGSVNLAYVNGGIAMEQETQDMNTDSRAQSVRIKPAATPPGAQLVLQTTLEELSRSMQAETRMLHSVLNKLVQADDDTEMEEGDYHKLGRVLDRLCVILYFISVGITIPMALFLGRQ
ncbi:CHRNB3 [Branchiostoma lanceolatum]|uniref:CHRNB3 protein n=1 Tax=Branchiostoma lanceolatum TaxID=7740 RepID=A0A8K0EEL0_BRALA|nr:CHRNB3 [Branchiostoma lanceolatum]